MWQGSEIAKKSKDWELIGVDEYVVVLRETRGCDMCADLCCSASTVSAVADYSDMIAPTSKASPYRMQRDEHDEQAKLRVYFQCTRKTVECCGRKSRKRNFEMSPVGRTFGREQ